jgi:hypothetical protein
MSFPVPVVMVETRTITLEVFMDVIISVVLVDSGTLSSLRADEEYTGVEGVELGQEPQDP